MTTFIGANGVTASSSSLADSQIKRQYGQPLNKDLMKRQFYHPKLELNKIHTMHCNPEITLVHNLNEYCQ